MNKQTSHDDNSINPNLIIISQNTNIRAITAKKLKNVSI